MFSKLNLYIIRIFSIRNTLKNLTGYFTKKNILFKELEEVSPKSLGSRKKITIYTGTSIDLNYYAIFIIDSKSRFIRKNAEDLLELYSKLIDFKKHNFKKKVLLISSGICSKSKTYLKENGWSIKDDFM